MVNMAPMGAEDSEALKQQLDYAVNYGSEVDEDKAREKEEMKKKKKSLFGKAEKMEKMEIPVVQLNTDGACHIETMSIKNILPDFDLDGLDIVFVENIGNLVCPAEFNIGESFRIAILSVPEGDDKVEKYPLMFSTTDGLVMNKYDMIKYQR